MCLKLLSPRGASVGEKDIHMVSRLAHFLYEPIKFLHLRTVCRNRDSLSARSLVRESIERCDSFVACRCFAGCDIDFGAACLEKTACFQLAVEYLSLFPAKYVDIAGNIFAAVTAQNATLLVQRPR